MRWQAYTCEKCGKRLPIETYKDMDLVLWVNHDEPDYAMCIPCWEALSEDEKMKIYGKAHYKPQIYENGMMRHYCPPRERLAQRVIAYLNDQQDYSSRVFDCGELGILAIRFRTTWQYEWYNPEPLPDSLRGEKEE